MEQSVDHPAQPLKNHNEPASDKIFDVADLKKDSRVVRKQKSVPEDFRSIKNPEDAYTSVELNEAKERTDVPLSARRFILFTFLCSVFFINVDGGSIPAAVLSMQKDLEITEKEVAILSSVTPFVCGVLTVFLAPVMIRFEARQVMILCQFSNFIGSVVFLRTKQYWLLIAGRALNGFAQAFISSYVSVWINEFAPQSSQTIWMAFIQFSGILGSLFGSIIGSIAADSESLGLADNFTWRHCFLIQGFSFLAIAIAWSCQPNERLDTQFKEKERALMSENLDSDFSQQKKKSVFEQLHLLKQLRLLFCNPVYMLTMLSMTILQFTAAGLQFWTIAYLQIVLYYEAQEAQITFVIILFTAMIPGVFMGATLADYYGGYKGKALKSALTLCFIFGSFASVFSLLETITFDQKFFAVLTWLFFFTGAGIMPIGSGIIVGCVPKFASNSASSLYNIFCNIVGISLAPVLSGIVMEIYSAPAASDSLSNLPPLGRLPTKNMIYQKREGMIIGYRLLLCGGFVLTVLFFIARTIVKRIILQLVKEQEMEKDQNFTSLGDNANPEEKDIEMVRPQRSHSISDNLSDKKPDQRRN